MPVKATLEFLCLDSDDLTGRSYKQSDIMILVLVPMARGGSIS